MEKAFSYPPLVFNVYKPPGITSYDVVRHFKRHLPRGYGKIGHFGTLDPFAEGILMIAVAGATRINEYVHQYLPKTYIAKGKLGVHTETGDLTVEPANIDDSIYLKETIAHFSPEFIEEQLQKKFVGQYMQAPHQYSAAKFEGKPLHEWARMGVQVVKDKVERQVYSLRVVDYSFPYLTIESTVSSGTYIRSLFKDCAEYLGTLGALETLIRSKIGEVSMHSSIVKESWPDRDNGKDWDPMSHGLSMDQVLPFPEAILSDADSRRYCNGIAAAAPQSLQEANLELPVWVRNQDHRLLGLARVDGGNLCPIFNLAQKAE